MINPRSTRTEFAASRTRRREKQQRTCPECGQTFSKTEHLERHVRSHTRERPFECILCGKTYTRHDSLLRHTRGHAIRDGESAPRELTAVISSPASRVGRAFEPVGVGEEGSLPREFSSALDDASFAGATGISAKTAYAESVVTPAYAASPGHQDSVTALDPRCESQPMLARELGSSRGLTASAVAGEDATTRFGDLYEGLLSNTVDLGYQDLGLNPYEPAWLLGGDFDVDALSLSISATISDLGPQPTAEFTEQRRLYAAADTLNRLRMPSPSEDAVSRVQQGWHTRISRAVTPQNSPTQLPDQDLVDERYREGLSHRLQPRMSNAALPSADFLNLCIKLYLTRFNPVFPIIHAPTFRPSSESALLLLSICSVGALFIGSTGAAAQGRKIFQILNKAILASWENYIRQDSREPLVLAQAAIIGQTFGMLSGQPQDLCMTESFHGTVIAWARQAGLFKINDSLAVLGSDIICSPETAWRTWTQAEESVRLILGLHIHDMEFATSFHHEPLLRHSVERLPLCGSEELFTAASAAQWRSLVRWRRGSTPAAPAAGLPLLGDAGEFEFPIRASHMFAYASLAGILSSIQEAKTCFLSDTSIQDFRDRLLAWYNEYCKLPKKPRHNPMNLMMLWHMGFMCLYADFDLLERSFGRDGALPAKRASFEIRAWASGSEARRGVLHALLVLKLMESLPIGVEPAMHVPKVLFYAAIFTHCYTTVNPQPNLLQDEINMPEFQVTAPTCSSYQGDGQLWPTLLAPLDSSTLCTAVDLLRRVGHWEISQKYAAILENLVDDFAKP
ncbi:hypothetical protein MHUMG1_09753 [Metarhizium humberi]|uniref:C2H2-type domain-containing protein n=1 Tax=Metarhizium humberi TaxID=2596975 RepID=A0A9P8M2V5_9HYPO|nr:hypothetical protein MHUMG1_09753 [Metarhizium humberi]